MSRFFVEHLGSSTAARGLFGSILLASVAAMLVACGGGVTSSSGAGGATAATSTTGSTIATGSSASGSGQGGAASASVASSSGATSSSGSTSSSSGGDCYAQCEADHPSEFLKLGLLLLTDCGCAPSAACSTDCAPYCANGQPSGAPPDGSPCEACLFAEGKKKAGSACATQAGAACIQDSMCAAFVTCAIACP